MTTFANIRREVLQEINKLPDQQLSQVLDFIHHIMASSGNTIDENENILNDPLADFIGGVEKGNLAQDCEQELYE
jgi:hypothetical protein